MASHQNDPYMEALAFPRDIEARCRRWQPHELFPIVESLYAILIEDKRISGIALTGSLARFEPLVHDIDLVVFHSGGIADGLCLDSDIEQRIAWQWDSYENRWSNIPPLGSYLDCGQGGYARLTSVRGGVPVNYIFVNERILWDCGELQFRSGVKREHRGVLRRVYDRINEFLNVTRHQVELRDYCSTIFCDIPLLLLHPSSVRDGLRNYVARFSPEETERQFLRVDHRCDKALCKPALPWPEKQKILKQQKGHTWHE